MNRKVIIGGIIGISAIALIVAGILRSVGSGGNVVKVKTARIEKGDISAYITADGIVEEVEKAEVFFDTPLKVNKVLMEVGQKVKKGQKLMELDLDELSSKLETLKINRNSQQISLDSKTLDAEVDRAANNLKTAERSYNDAKKAYEDNKVLYDANAISKAELDMSEKTFIDAESGLKNARLAYNTAVENRDNSKKTSSDNIRVTDLQISELEKKISVIREQCSSPIDGVVASVGIKEGAYTGTMQSVYKIINPDKLQVRARVNEYDIKDVSVDQKVRLTGDAIDKGTEILGSVSNVSPVAVTNMTSSGNETIIEVLIRVNGAGDVLKPGLNVTCEIATLDKEDILLAPMDAITPDKDDNLMVFVVDETTNTVRQQKVTVGINSDMQFEVLEGLKEGDIVVVDPQPSYTDGMRVRITD